MSSVWYRSYPFDTLLCRKKRLEQKGFKVFRGFVGQLQLIYLTAPKPPTVVECLRCFLAVVSIRPEAKSRECTT